ncbi:protein WHAT'S THIS FACTOR 1 homolog, chloroplastic [Silene latifolia]|uniref:protein WHAT'S THIS FACTOR 1 homolog, chloroplastic n=1 Tax=Silene latifolia TaxID=37657 RepID=UPI003D779219
MRFKRPFLGCLGILTPNPSRNTYCMFIQFRQKTSGGKKPKKKVYFREHELDKVMELQKKPALILELKDIIQSQKNQCILVRDLEKEVGFIRKWNCMAVIEKYPTIFRVGGGNSSPISVSLTEKARRVVAEEEEARMLMEPILVKNLRKLLMLTVDCRLPLDNVELIEAELGLPKDFKKSLIPKYPQFFSVKDVNGKDYLHLESWDSSLAVTAREEKLAQEGVLKNVERGKKVMISRDGNYSGPHAFRICYPAGFRPNTSFLEELRKWQRTDFPSPYLNARRFDPADPRTRKRVIAVLHELLSLTISKRMTSVQMHAFNSELYLPARLLLCLIKHHGIFYITNKGVRSTVFLKEAYDGSNLIEKGPLLRFNDKFVALTGRREPGLHHEINLNRT